MIIEIFAIWLLLGFVFFFVSFNYRKEFDFAHLGMVLGSFIVFFGGLLVLANPLEYKIGNSIITSGNTTTTMNLYETISRSSDPIIFYSLFLGLFVIGLAMFLWTYLSNQQMKDNDMVNSED